MYKYNGLSSVFLPALDLIKEKDFGTYGPTPLLEYLEKYGFPKTINAPAAISIDSYEKLHQSLKEQDTMILRLGRNGKGTQFSLVRAIGRLNDFFLIDTDIFSKNGEIIEPEFTENQILAYKFLPNLTENSLVNLGFTSGLLSYALGVDKVTPIFPPATCNSTFSFVFKPHSQIESTVVHNQGQVEIDAMFVEKRGGKNTLFVIEAKSGTVHKSLSKHKLLYPVLGIADSVPQDIEIVPVYLKVNKTPKGIHFHVVECEVPDPRKNIVAYDELKVKKYSHLIMPSQLLK
jgi:hypothetical protein